MVHEIDWKLAARGMQDALLRDLRKLLAIPSIKDEKTVGSDAPCGQGNALALAFMLELAQLHGLKTEMLEGIVGYAAYGGTDYSENGAEMGNKNDAECGDGVKSDDGYIAVLSHLDVVPPGNGWTSPPFEPEIRDGRLYARGAIDDKGPTMAAFYGLLTVKSLGLPLRRPVRLIWGTDEESGMTCMDAYNRLQPPPLAGFTPDADFPIVHAEKGQLNARMTMDLTGTEEASADLRLVSFRSGRVANMVPDEASAVVIGPADLLTVMHGKFNRFLERERGGEAKLVTGSNREPARLVMQLRGKSVHGMVPQEGVNAGLRLIHFLSEIELAGDGGRFVRGIDSLLNEDWEGQALGIACHDEMTGPLTVNAGVFIYEPATHQACVQLNIRYPISGDGEEIESRIVNKLSDFDWRLEQVRLKRPHAVPPDHPLVTTLQHVYEEETGQEAKLLSTGGGTYAAKLACGVAFGPLFPGETDTAHQADEWIALDRLMQATAIYARAIYELANADWESSLTGNDSN